MLEGRKPAPRRLLLEKAKYTPKPPSSEQWELADLANLSVERVGEFGSVYLALALWRRLGLHELLSELMDCGHETVPWAEVAAVLTAGKFCGQASELGVAEGGGGDRQFFRHCSTNKETLDPRAPRV